MKKKLLLGSFTTIALLTVPIISTSMVQKNNIKYYDMQQTSYNAKISADLKTHVSIENSSIINGRAGSILQDKAGNIWSMGNHTPLQVLRPGATQWEDAGHGSNIHDGSDGTIFQDNAGNVWSMGNHTPLQVLRPGATQWEDAGHGSNITNGSNGTIFQDKAGNIWAIGYLTPLQVLRVEATQWEDAGHGSNIKSSYRGLSILQDKAGNIWAMGNHTPLQVLRPGATQWEDAGHGSNIKGGTYGTIFQDKAGNIWVMGNNTSLQVLKVGATQWEDAGHGSNIHDGYDGTIFQDKAGNIWSMGYLTPLQVLRPGATQWEDAGHGSNIIGGRSGVIFQDKAGNVWSMGNNTSLQVLKVGATQWEDAGHGSNIHDGSEGTILQDKDGNIWAMGYGSSLQVLRKGSNIWWNKYTIIKKPIYLTNTVLKKPTTSTRHDGEVKFTLTGFDPKTMVIKLANGSSGTLGTYENNVVKVSGLANKEHAQIEIFLKSNQVWNNGSQVESVKSKIVNVIQTIIGLEKPIYLTNTVLKKPTTSTTHDGEVAFILTGFDPKTMVIKLANGSSGTLGTYGNNVVEVSGLANNQHAQIEIFLKSNQVWNNGSQVESVKSNIVNVIQTIIGLEKPIYVTSGVLKKPTTSSSHDGVAEFVLTGFDPKTMVIKLANGSSGMLGTYENNAIKLSGLANKEHAQIEIFLKDNYVWNDGSKVKSVKSNIVNMIQTITGLEKPIYVTSVVLKKPTTSSSHDGVVEFVLTGFDPKTMGMRHANDSSGTLGTYENNAIKLSGLANNEHAQIEIFLKPNQVWSNGSQVESVKSNIVNVIQTILGLEKPIYLTSVVLKKPTTSSSHDGVAEFVLTGFDPKTMVIKLANGSSGVLGTYGNNVVEVSGLANKEHAQIEIFLKPNQVWSNGSQAESVKSKIVNMIQKLLKQKI